MSRIEQAIILAGGEGQRLKPFTTLKPKVMLSIANKPILGYAIEALAQAGVRHIVIVIGYRREEIQDYFGSGKKYGVTINYVVQETQVGTADALKQTRNMAASNFLVIPGDNIIEADTVLPLVSTSGNTIVVKHQENISKYGAVLVKKDRVAQIVEKPEVAVSYLVNTGIYALTHDIFPFTEQEPDLTQALQAMIDQGCSIEALEVKGTWLDAVYPIDILRLNEALLNKVPASSGGTIEQGVVTKGKVSVGNGTTIKSGSYFAGPVVIGDNCDIGPSIYVSHATSIGNNVSVSPFSQIINSVIGNEVVIGSNCTIRDSIIASGCVLGDGITIRSQEIANPEGEEARPAKLGALIGDFCELEDNIVILPGISIGVKARIKSMKVIREDIPEGSLVV